MSIEELPIFKVHEIKADRALGSFDDPLWMGERYLADLMLPDQRMIGGRFVNVDLESKVAVFLPAVASELVKLLAGLSYPRLDGYWGKRAALVLDDKRAWISRAFEPSDAVEFHRDGHYMVAKSTNKEMETGGRLVKGGWDHDHCEICSATISSRYNPIALFSEPDHWVCRECYDRYVFPRSLGFIVVYRPPVSDVGSAPRNAKG